VEISISEIGTLTNTVAVGREPFAFLAAETLEETR
jgi:2-dehydro-3-deoxy-D-arabinonate dehydratase